MSAWTRLWAAVAAIPALLSAAAFAAEAPAETQLALRGQVQTLRLYGTRGRPVAIVASGDGGWIHLGPDVAQFLSGQGWYVVGFDTKAYLSAFTSKQSTLKVTDVPADFQALIDAAASGSPGPPVLIGVSEGAGLAVLAAADAAVKPKIAGVIALGLPATCELGWRWRDSMIYITKGVPREPTFSTADLVPKVAPLPIVAIHSTRDEFVTVDEVRRVMANAGQPSRLWFVEAQNHRFSGNTGEFERKLLEALSWIKQQRD